jgi:predicted MFS family arabinose efflux permease
VHPALALAAVLVLVASIGYCATLMLQERLMALTPPEHHGQALGLQSSATLAMQAVGAALAGTIADQTSVTTAIVAMAAGSVAITLLLSPGLRSARPDLVSRPGRCAVGEPCPGRRAGRSPPAA